MHCFEAEFTRISGIEKDCHQLLLIVSKCSEVVGGSKIFPMLFLGFFLLSGGLVGYGGGCADRIVKNLIGAPDQQSCDDHP